MDNKTIITTEDVKNIVNGVFNGRDNDFTIILNDIDNNTSKSGSIIEYLNMEFFNFRNRLVEEDNIGYNHETPSLINNWANSLNVTKDKLYGLVDIIDIETTPSKQIDNASVAANITFLCPIEKVVNLEHYVAVLRNKYIGNPQEIINSFGNKINLFLLIGILDIKEDTIQDTALGERAICELGFNFNYIANAETSYDVKVNFLPNAFFDEKGKPVKVVNGEIKSATLLNLPILKQTHQLISSTTPVPYAKTPSTTGYFATALTRAITFNYYIYKSSELSKMMEDIFWSFGSIGVDKSPNIKIALEIQKNDKSYKYNCILSEMETVIEDGQFILGSMSLVTSAE